MECADWIRDHVAHSPCGDDWTILVSRSNLYAAMKLTPRSACSTLLCAFALSACSGDGTPDPATNNGNGNNNTNKTLSAVEIALGVESVSLGSIITPTILAKYSDASEVDVTAEVTLTSSNPDVLQVATDPLTLNALAEGSAQLTVEYMGMMGTLDVTVAPPSLVGIELVPPTGEFGMGGSLTVNAIAVYSNDYKEQITADAAWDSSRTNVAIMSSQDAGRVVAFGMGTTTLTATYEGFEASGDYTVTEPSVEYMTITPERARMNLVDAVQFGAVAVYSDHDPAGTSHIEDVTDQVTWTSSDPSIITISATGEARALGDGEAFITATANNGISVSTIARSVSVNCSYPEGFDNTIATGKTIAPLFWVDATTEAGDVVDFSLEAQHCDTAVTSIIFKVAAGWCGPCRALAQAMEPMTPDFHAAGAMIVHVMVETAGGSLANNEQAAQIVESWVPNEPTGPWPTYRVGSADTQGGGNTPFARAISAFPTSFVVRTSDMKIVKTVVGAGTQNELLQAAQNIENL